MERRLIKSNEELGSGSTTVEAVAGLVVELDAFEESAMRCRGYEGRGRRARRGDRSGLEPAEGGDGDADSADGWRFSSTLAGRKR